MGSRIYSARGKTVVVVLGEIGVAVSSVPGGHIFPYACQDFDAWKKLPELEMLIARWKLRCYK